MDAHSYSGEVALARSRCGLNREELRCVLRCAIQLSMAAVLTVHTVFVGQGRGCGREVASNRDTIVLNVDMAGQYEHH